MISATFDTNIYIRAINFGGPAATLLGHARAKAFRLDISEPIIEETARVLRERFQKDGYSIADSVQRLRRIGNLVTPTETLSVIKEDPDDDRILECAGAARSDYLVNEDKDLLRLGNFRRTKILNIHDFAALGRGWNR